MSDFALQSDGARATQAGGKLQQKQPATKPPGAAGYGYEIFVVTTRDQQWPLAFLQWAVSAEIAAANGNNPAGRQDGAVGRGNDH